jgi:hypothetical protein
MDQKGRNMRITKKWLEKNAACERGIEWFCAKKFKTDKKVIRELMEYDYFDWANWALVKLLNKKNRLKYAIYCANLVLPIFEERYPNDKRPREAIIAAKKVLKNNTKKNREAAANAAAANKAAIAYAVFYAAFYASYAAVCAAHAATCAAHAAACINYAADCANYAIDCADYVADCADRIAIYDVKNKIINYGLRLLK